METRKERIPLLARALARAVRSLGRRLRPLALAGALLGGPAAAGAADAAAPPAPLPEEIPLPLDPQLLSGKVVLLDFWASWCAPCVKSFPWLSSLQVRHRDDGLVVIGVNVDRKRKDADAFLERHRPAFPVAFDPEGALAEEYELDGMPSSILFARDGTRRFDHVGFRESDTPKIEEEIRALLAEEPPEKENP